MKFWRIFLLLMAAGGITTEGFVYYLVNDQHLLRWNLDGGTAHTNVVNPATKRIRYFLASDAYSSRNRVNELNAVRASFDQWEKVPGTRLAFEEGGLLPTQSDTFNDNTNVVFWAKSSLWIANQTVNLSGQAGYTSIHFSTVNGAILDADIVLNGVQVEWFTDFNNTSNQARFVESTLLHEIGHFIGLDHTPVGGATVMNGAPGVSTEPGLSADEIAAARYLYPAPNQSWSTIRGKVTRNGQPVFGAMILLEDGHGNISSGTVSRKTGDYHLPGLNPGTYYLRVSPFDPANLPNSSSLLRPEEIAWDYSNADTSFLPTTNITIFVSRGETRQLNVAVSSGPPAFRITSISKPSQFESLVSPGRYAVQLQPGQSRYIGVLSANFPPGATLQISGSGLSLGATTYWPNKSGNMHALTALITVATNAVPGLRSFIVQSGNNLAYANGYLEILSPVPDFNFDNFDDRFQRQHWGRWTAPESAPEADPDGDLFSNRYEYETGTNPTSANSYSFLIQSVRVEETQAVVTWKADIGKRYALFGRTAFSPQSSWVKVGEVVADRSLVSLSDPSGGGGQTKFYRLQVIE